MPQKERGRADVVGRRGLTTTSPHDNSNHEHNRLHIGLSDTNVLECYLLVSLHAPRHAEMGSVETSLS